MATSSKSTKAKQPIYKGQFNDSSTRYTANELYNDYYDVVEEIDRTLRYLYGDEAADRARNERDFYMHLFLKRYMDESKGKYTKEDLHEWVRREFKCPSVVKYLLLDECYRLCYYAYWYIKWMRKDWLERDKGFLKWAYKQMTDKDVSINVQDALDKLLKKERVWTEKRALNTPLKGVLCVLVKCV